MQARILASTRIHVFLPRIVRCTILRETIAKRNELLQASIISLRLYATPPPHINPSNISMERYHAISDSAMDGLLECLETILEGIGSDEYEVEYSSGVMTLKLGVKGTYVINKQPPNRQIWLSSPFSGPKRYDYCPDRHIWYYTRDGKQLDDLLSVELSEALGKEIKIQLG